MRALPGLGFSYVGAAFLLALFVPNIVWAVTAQPLGYDPSGESTALVWIERIGQVLTTVTALGFTSTNLRAWSPWSLWLVGAVTLLVLYEVCWVRYFAGGHTVEDFYRGFLGVPVPLATLPVAAFLLLGVYGRLLPLIVAVAILGVGHIGIHLEHAHRLDPPRIAWSEVALPVPTGSPGRLVVRDALACAGRWYAAGGVVGEDGESRPAAWTSPDGRTWTALAFAPSDAYYPQRAVIQSAACDEATGALVMVGAKPGGGHGNPRVSTWHQRADGAFTDAEAPFELYGGESAVNVGPVAAGPPGWLIAGNRTNGAAVWLSADGVTFELHAGVPGLADDATARTSASDAVRTDDGWTVVGGADVPGRVGRVPMAWTSADGLAWQRVPLPEDREGGRGAGSRELQRVAAFRGGVLAVGVDGDAFSAWERQGGRSVLEDFGVVAPGAARPPAVTGLAATGDVALATVSDGTAHRLWASVTGTGWTEEPMPVAVPATGDSATTVAAGPGATVLLIADDGSGARLFLGALEGE